LPACLEQVETCCRYLLYFLTISLLLVVVVTIVLLKFMLCVVVVEPSFSLGYQEFWQTNILRL